ncbi:MAG: hypothetical protein EA422_02285, partial [Gemmatimonadales bacterium]
MLHARSSRLRRSALGWKVPFFLALTGSLVVLSASYASASAMDGPPGSSATSPAPSDLTAPAEWTVDVHESTLAVVTFRG